MGVRVVPEVGKAKPRTAGIVACRATWKASAGRRRLIRIERHHAELNQEIDRDRTTLKVQVEPKRAQPS